jgi:cobalt-zinc-cadmium efflux system membrane fusion protein
VNRLFAILLLLLACGKSAPPQPPQAAPDLFHLPVEQVAQLQIVTVARQPVSRPLQVPAAISFDALRTSEVVPLVDGKVAKLLVHEGDLVKAGQPLMAIASPGSADAQAALERDQAALSNATLVLARDKDLYEHKAISLEELQAAQLAASTAQSSVTSDRARVRITGTGKGDALLKSPIAGMVAARRVSVGDSVQGGATAAFTITDPAAMWVIAQLYQEDLRRVAVGDPAEIRSAVLPAPIAARVSYIGAMLDPDSLTIPVRIAARNVSGALKSGMYVDVSISPARTEQAILVPAFAVLRDSDNLPFVYKLAGESAYARVHVDLGDQVGSAWVIRGGLAEGDKVVGNGALFVQFADSLER